MIINIRGTHGSGKSTIAKTLITTYKGHSVDTDIRGRPKGYVLAIPDVGDLYIVGSYETACGGCDSIQPYADIWPRVVEFAEQGHVLFEGALVSSSYGEIGRASEQYGDQFIFAFMDTPLEVCLQRIVARRQAKGNLKPLDPKNTKNKLESISKSINKIKNEFGRRCVIIDHKDPIPQILELLNE